MRFQDRIAAGRALADELSNYAANEDVVVLALPRGGVPIAYEIAKLLSLSMDVMLVRKLGVPGHEELAMGAIAWGNVLYLNKALIEQLQIPQSSIDETIAHERSELDRRNKLYRGTRPPPTIAGKIVLVVDDGLATGATMSAAVSALRQAKAKEIIAVVPVGARESCQELSQLVDRIVCLYTPEPFYGVGQWYRDFSQVTDAEVQTLLALSEEQSAKPALQGNGHEN